MRFTTLLFTLLLGIITTPSSAENIYILFDQSCMERFEYEQINNLNGFEIKESSFAYYINMGNEEKIFFETGQEKVAALDNLPKNTRYCGDLVYTPSFANNINNKLNVVFMVVPTGQKYKIAKIINAGYFFSNDNNLGLISKDHGYSYDYKRSEGALISFEGSKDKVNFLKRTDVSCPSKYSFRIKTGRKTSITESVLPQIGVVERVYEKTKKNKVVNSIKLVSINGIAISSYRDAVCNNYLDYLKRDAKPAVVNTTSSQPSTGYTDTKIIAAVPSSYTTTETSSCSHIYRDVDRALYIDRNTNAPFTGNCGGSNYNNGFKVVTATTPIVSTPTTYTSSKPTYTSTPKVTKKVVPSQPTFESPEPKIIYDGEAFDGTFTSVEAPKPATINSDCDAVTDANHHVVLKGQTLYRISRIHNIEVSKLKALNHLSDNTIYPCQIIKISESIDGDIFTRKGVPKVTKKKVKERVAFKWNTKVEEKIKAAPANDFVEKGVPAVADPNQKLHKVLKGETLYSISKFHNVAIQDIISLNNIENNVIAPGQLLKLSGCNCPISDDFKPKGLDKEEFSQKGVDVIPHGGRFIHIVKEGENLYSIAKMYNVDLLDLLKINNLEANEILVKNQRLYIK